MIGLGVLGAVVMQSACGTRALLSSAVGRQFWLRPRSYEARLVGEHDQLRAVPRMQLDHGTADMRARGRRADDELGRDLVVRQALGNERDDLTLSIRE